MSANFLTGPVALKSEVQAAFLAPPVSHRDADFVDSMNRTRTALTELVDASHVALMLGSGTLANDAVAAQLASRECQGLILSNGEFGERLVDHARRWNLRFEIARENWGQSFDWTQVARLADHIQPQWIWAVLTETSTGVMNSLQELRALSSRMGADLCLDAISAIGLVPVNLQGIRFATAVSGKGLASYPGLAVVFHDGRLADAGLVPRYLDLASYDSSESVPFTHSSNLVSALECSLTRTSWPQKFDGVRQRSQSLRNALRRHALAPLAADEIASPGVMTLLPPAGVRAGDVAQALATDGYQIAWQSSYLMNRNWMQIALMGEIDDIALRQLPGAIAAWIEHFAAAHRRGSDRWRSVGLPDQRTRKYRRP